MESRARNESGDILVVDDDGPTVDLIVDLLCDAGYAVRQAASGAEALQTIAARSPALVLLDVRMPMMDGAAVSQQIRARDATLPIVLVTAVPEQARAIVAEGYADCVVAKPFDLDELLACIAQYMPASDARPAAVERWQPDCQA